MADAPADESKKPKQPKGGGMLSQAKAMVGLSVALGAMNLGMKALGSPIKALASLPGLAKKLVSGFGGLVKAFSGLDISLKNVSKSLASGLAASDKMQERALGMGKTLGGFQKAFGGQLDKMPGILTQRLGTTMDMFGAGLRGNTVRVAQLAQIQKLAGRDSKALINSFASMQVDMAMTNAGLDSLAAATINAQYTYGVNMEKMVGAMNALSQETKDAGALEGLGPVFAGAVGKVTAMMGGQGAKELAVLMKVLTGGSQSLADAARLGLLGQRAQIKSDTTTDQLAKILVSSMKIGKSTMDGMALSLDAMGDVGMEAFALKQTFKEAAPAITKLTSLMDVEAMSKAKNMNIGSDILKTLKQQALALWEPISNLWMEKGAHLYNMITENAVEIGAAFTVYIVNPIRDIVGGFMGSMLEQGSLMEGLKRVFKTVGLVISWVAQTLGNTFGGGGSMYEQVVGFFGDTLAKIADGFDEFVLKSLPTIEVAFLGIAIAILKALDKIPFLDIDKDTIGMLEERRSSRKLGMMSDEDIANLEHGITEGTSETMSKLDIAGMVVGGLLAATAVVLTAGAAAPLIAAGVAMASTGAAAVGISGAAIATAGTVLGAAKVVAIGATLATGVIGGGLLGDKIEDNVKGEKGKFYLTHPISGVEEVFDSLGEAQSRGKKIQDDLKREVAGRGKQMKLGDEVRRLQENALKKETKGSEKQLDYLSIIAAHEAETAENTRKEEEDLEIVPGTSFQSTMGNMLSSSILNILQAANESSNAQMLGVQEEIRDIGLAAEIQRNILGEPQPITGAAGN